MKTDLIDSVYLWR